MSRTRRQFIAATALVSAGVSVFHHQMFAGSKNDDQPYIIRPLRRNVGYFTERGGTIGWMISKNGIVVVDTEFPDQARHLIDEIKSKSVKQIDLLVNTHHHGDHTSGNIAFKGMVKRLLAHENSKKNQMRVAEARGTEDKQLYPDKVFTDEWSHKIDDETIKLRYFGPAHTNGDSVIHFENANIVHMGDLIFNRRHPYIDKSAGASIKNWIEVLGKCCDIFDCDSLFIFGHSGNDFGIVGRKDDLKAFQDYLSGVLDMVSKQIRAGKSKEEIMKIESIPTAPQWKGEGIQRSLLAAWDELNS